MARNSTTGTAPERCDDCPDGGDIYQRDDDTTEAVANRISVYHQETAPVLGFYAARGVLADIPGEGAVEAVNESALLALGENAA